MLRFWTTQKPGTRSFAQRYEAIAWLTGKSKPRIRSHSPQLTPRHMIAAGIYHSPIPTSVTPDSLNTAVFASPSLLSINANGDAPVPVSIALTEWHFILLFQDRLVAFSRLTENVVWEARVPLVSADCPSGRNAVR